MCSGGDPWGAGLAGISVAGESRGACDVADTPGPAVAGGGTVPADRPETAAAEIISSAMPARTAVRCLPAKKRNRRRYLIRRNRRLPLPSTSTPASTETRTAPANRIPVFETWVSAAVSMFTPRPAPVPAPVSAPEPAPVPARSLPEPVPGPLPASLPAPVPLPVPVPAPAPVPVLVGIGVGDGDADVGAGVAVGVVVADGAAVVGNGVAEAVPVGDGVAVAQPGKVKTLVSSATCPFRASARPSTLVPVVAVMEVSARMLPTNVDAVPRVAELPTCQ